MKSLPCDDVWPLVATYVHCDRDFAVAERKYCAALLACVRTTTYVPPDFPKPTGQELAQLTPRPNGSTDSEAPFAGLASNRNKVFSAVSQVVALPAWHCSFFLLFPLGQGAPLLHSPHHLLQPFPSMQ